MQGVKVCWIHLFRCLSRSFQHKNYVWKREFFGWSNEMKYCLLHFDRFQSIKMLINCASLQMCSCHLTHIGTGGAVHGLLWNIFWGSRCIILVLKLWISLRPLIYKFFKNLVFCGRRYKMIEFLQPNGTWQLLSCKVCTLHFPPTPFKGIKVLDQCFCFQLTFKIRCW